MKTDDPLHGVHIREHKEWNTKTIYNNGHIMRVYRHCPKVIDFNSPMVNDFNQLLCGGWSMIDIPDTKEAVVQQLLTRRKPFGVANYWCEQEANTAMQRLHDAGIVAEIRQRIVQRWDDIPIYDVLACQNITVNHIGDLDTLARDYLRVGVVEDVQAYANRALATFFDGWDVEDNPLWLTGLILGYPVENTISIYTW